MCLLSVLGCFGFFSVSACACAGNLDSPLLPPTPKDRLFHIITVQTAQDTCVAAKPQSLVSLWCQSHLCSDHNIEQSSGSSV